MRITSHPHAAALAHLRPLPPARLSGFRPAPPHSKDAVESIGSEGFRALHGRHSKLRYGDGYYFADQSCKAHQYAGVYVDEYGGELHTVLYCRVAMGRSLEFKKTSKALRARGWLSGMHKPESGDPVFNRQMNACGMTAKAKMSFDSIEVDGWYVVDSRPASLPKSPPLPPGHRLVPTHPTDPRQLRRRCNVAAGAS